MLPPFSRWQLSIALIPLCFSASGCNNGCTDVPAVIASMTATVTRLGQSSTIQLRNLVTMDGTSAEGWEVLHRFASSDVSTFSGGASWVASGSGSEDDPLQWLALQLAAPFRAGDVLELTAVPGQALASAWGTAPEGTRAFQASAPNFVTASGSGTVEVLGLTPLRLRVDVHPLNETGQEIQVRGDMSLSTGTDQRCD